MEGKAETTAEPAKNSIATPIKTIEQSFLEEKFKLYYQLYLTEPREIARREFGFGFQKKIDIRHYSFQSKNDLLKFIERECPPYISYSSAYYNYPGARQFSDKELLGADLIFDLDADTTHKSHNQVYCPECLDKVKEQAIWLLEEFLFKDFGIGESEVKTNFSGSKGFHFHLDGKAFQELSKHARREIADYINGTKIGVEAIAKKTFVKSDGEKKVLVYGLPNESSKGWRKRVFEELKRQGNEKTGKDADIRKALKKIRAGTQIDGAVSFDMHRLIRLQDSLHGDTGLVAKTLAKSDLTSFQPIEHARAFRKGFAQIIPLEKVVLPGIVLEKGKKAGVPLAQALLLLCKKKAVLA